LSFEIREFTGVVGVIQANGALAHAHHDELAASFHAHEFDPDLPRYQRLEDLGVLVCLGAYDGDDLVGYSFNVLSTHSHYQTVLCAHNDLLYLKPEYRTGANGLLLMRATRDALKARGVSHVLWYAKPDTALDKLLARTGQRVHEIMYSEAL
jgi:predicted GNAT superfamily acetyltransferase